MPTDLDEPTAFHAAGDPLIDAARAAFWAYQDSLGTGADEPMAPPDAAPLPDGVAGTMASFVEAYRSGTLSGSDDLQGQEAEAFEVVQNVEEAGGSVVLGEAEGGLLLGTAGGDLLMGGGATMDAADFLDALGL